MRACLAVVVLLAAPAHALADDEPAPTAIRATLAGTSATIVAHYRIPVAGPPAPITSMHLELPDGAIVTGATITEGGTAHRLALLGATAADEELATVFSSGSAPPAATTTWAAWIAREWQGVALTLGGGRAATVEVALELLAPTCFARDARYVRVPATWHASPTVVAADPDVAAHCSGASDTRWLAFADRDAARRPAGERIVATTVRLALEDDLHVARTEVVLASDLADVPADLATVILVDESRSLTAEQRSAQHAIVAGYLRAAPNSRVQVLGVSRRSRTLVAGWTLASRAAPRIERELAALTPRNGTNIDEALATAGRALATTQGTRRVLLVTDGALAERLARAPAQLASAVPAGTIIQVAIVERPVLDRPARRATAPALARTDGALLARLAAVTQGIAMRIVPTDTAPLAVDATALVRPTSLDHVRITGLGWTELDDGVRSTLPDDACRTFPGADTLRAGTHCTWWSRGTRDASAVQLEGLLWNRRIVRVVRPARDPQRTIARELSARDVAPAAILDPAFPLDGSREEQLRARIDDLARGVTQTTSLFARWGEQGPLLGVFGAGMGAGGGTRGGTLSSPISGPDLARTQPHLDLTAQLAPLVAGCHLDGAQVTASLDLTFDEIVDVRVHVPVAGDRGAALRTCVEEAIWSAAVTTPSMDAMRRATAAF